MDAHKRVKFATRIFKEHDLAIRAMIRRCVSNRKEWDDVYQNLFLSLVCNPPSLPLANTLAYLNTVVKHDIINTTQRRKRCRQVLCKYATSQAQKEANNDPAEKVIREEEMQRIAECVRSSLPARQARAVLERYGEGRSISDIAKGMHVKKRTISRYLCIGLKWIRWAVTID